MHYYVCVMPVLLLLKTDGVKVHWLVPFDPIVRLQNEKHRQQQTQPDPSQRLHYTRTIIRYCT